MSGEIPMLEGYPHTMTMDQSDAYLFWRSFNSIMKAYDFAISRGGQFYTQVDTDDGEDRVYSKGNHIVNRTGIWLVVKKGSGNAALDEQEYEERWELPKEFGDSQLDQEEDDKYEYRKKHGGELK